MVSFIKMKICLHRCKLNYVVENFDDIALFYFKIKEPVNQTVSKLQNGEVAKIYCHVIQQ